MEFIDYYKRIKDNRNNIIDYYVKQFGEDKRNLFEERFDRIKFCFWVKQPEDIDQIAFLKFNEQYLKQTVNFIRDTIKENIDISIRKHMYIRCNDDKINSILNNFFGPTKSISHYYRPVQYQGIWTFLEDLSETDIEQSYEWHNMFAKKNEEKEISLDEYILSARCDFLREMGCFPKDMDDKTIASLEEYKFFVRKYSELAKKALEYKKRAEEPVIEFIEFCKAQNAKEEELGNDRLAIAKSRIIGGNFIPENEEEIEPLFMDGEHTTITKTNDRGEITDVIIFYNPFFDPFPINTEINIRHEIRHAMTSSASMKNGEVIIKVGNKIARGENIEAETFNEYVTQRDAIEETKKELEKKISLMSEEPPSFEDYDKIGKYDFYLQVGDIVYSEEPLLSAIRNSQIAETNEDLYKVISLEQLHKLEELMEKSPSLQLEDIKKLRNLMQELGIQDTDAKLKEQYGYEEEEQEL